MPALKKFKNLFGIHYKRIYLTTPICNVITVAATAPEAAPPNPRPKRGESPQASIAEVHVVTFKKKTVLLFSRLGNNL